MIQKKIYLIGIIVFALIPTLLTIFISDVYKFRESYKNDLIRFHVIANSDSPSDQALKLKVRDKVIKEMSKKFDTNDIDEAKKIIIDNMEEIENFAREEIEKEGYDYPVRVALEEANFPTKNYGSIALPAGRYEALRVIIGSGQGKNWWCVLFPPLCFIDVKSGLTDQRTKEELKEVLTEEEYNMINTAATSEGQLPIKLKFKVVEILEESKWKLSKIVGLKN